MDRLLRLGADGLAALGQSNAQPTDGPVPDSAEQVYISSLALLKMLKHGRAGVPMEVMGLMLGEFVDDYTVTVVDVFAMPQSGTGVSVEAVDPVFQAKMLDMLKQTGRPEMVVGWYHSHPGFGCWLSGVDMNTQQSFEALSDRAVAVVVDPIQSVKGKVVIDAFRLINPNLVIANQEPRQTTSNVGHLHKPSIQALIHGLNRQYYSLPINYRKNKWETKMLMDLNKNTWKDGLKLADYDVHCANNHKSLTAMLDLLKAYTKSLEEEEKMTPEQLVVKNVGKMDALTEEQRALIEEKKRKALEFRSRIRPNRPSCLVGGAPKLSETRPVLAPRLNEFNTKPSILESRSLPLAQSNFPKPAVGQARFPSSTPAVSIKDSSSVSSNSKTTVMQPAIPSVSKPFTHVLCTLCSKTAFEVQARYHAGLSQLYKSLPSRQYNPTNRKWSFALSDYNEFVSSARKMEGIAVEGLPNVVLKMFRSAISAKQTIAQKEKAEPKDLSDYIPQDMIDVLFPFQREGVGLIVARSGRVLLADDMGLGKTVQALTAASVYRSEWPVLIVSPSSVRFSWKDQCLRWLANPMHVTADDILVVATGRDLDGVNEYQQKLITIISYDLMTKCSVQLSRCRFGVVIMDESHFLKNNKTARTKAALPILKHSKRALLLSGTPAVSRPAELYPQICGVSPDLFRGGFHEFGLRYCAAKQLPWGWDYTGCSNMTELQLILEESIMIRRTKNEVLSQLPPKRREVVILDPNAIKTGRLQRHAKTMQMTNLSDDERRSAMLQYYHQTASVKITALQQYVSDLIEVDRKFLLYAHHTEVLDAMSNLLTEKSIDFIRIDGRTNSEQRSVVCKKFQEEESCRVALLSITAAGTGLNLTAASLVVFGELYWNPGVLVQAEDRAYRIGQQDSVVVRYLMAEGTADDYIWSLIERKLEVLSKAGLNKERSWQFDTTRLGPSPAEQQCILDYFGSDSPDGGCAPNAGHVDIEDSSPVFELQFRDITNEPAQKRFKVAHLFDQQATATTSGDEPLKSRPVLVAGTPETSPNKELPVESAVVSCTEGQAQNQSISLVGDDMDDNTLLEAVLSTEVQMLTECLLNDEGLSM